MTDYFCAVTNNIITHYNLYRPRAWGETLFGVNATDEEYIACGLYPILDQQTSFDPETQIQDSVYYEISDTSVLKKNTVRNLTAEELEEKRKALIPTVVSMRQARLALLQAGLLTAVNTAINTAEEAVKIEWEYATEVKRDHALVQSLASALSLTETQLDELFTLAGTL